MKLLYIGESLNGNWVRKLHGIGRRMLSMLMECLLSDIRLGITITSVLGIMCLTQMIHDTGDLFQRNI